MATSAPGRLLIVDDELELMTVLCEMLNAQGYEAQGVTTASAALALFKTQSFDVLLTDLMMPETDGLALLRAAVEIDPYLVGIIMTGQGTVQTAVEAMKVGAFDYVLKPFRLQTILPILERALGVHSLRAENLQLHEAVTLYEESARLHEQVRQSEQRYRTLAEAAHEMIYILDLQGQIEYVNSYAARAFGRTPEELIGQSSQVFFPPETLAHQQQNVRRALETLTPIYAEELTPILGVGRWLGTSLVPLQDEAGHVYGILGISRDITQHKKAEAALVASEKRFRALLENSADAVALLNQQAQLLYFASPAAEQILGYTMNENTGRNVFDLIHPADLPQVTPQLQNLLQQPQSTTSIELRLLHKDGSWRWVRATGTNLLNDPAVQAVVINYRDITQRKLAENRLAAFAGLAHQLASTRTSEEASRLIVDVADTLIGWDACILHLYSAEKDVVTPVLNIDIVDGQRSDVAAAYSGPPSVMARRVLNEGKTRHTPQDTDTPLVSFGDMNRETPSRLFVPIRNGTKINGILSIQSYTPDAYNDEDLNTLQALADLCGGALDRLQTIEQIQFQASLLNRIGQAVIATDRNGLIIYWNLSAETLYGWSENEALGLNIVEIVPTALIHRAAFRVIRHITKGESWSGEFTVRRRDGGSFPVLITNTPIYDTKGRLAGVVGVSTNLTESKQRERELEALAAVSAALRAANTRAEMFPILLEQVSILFQATASSIDLRDAQTGEAVVAAALGEWEASLGFRIPPNQGLSSLVFTTGQPYFTDDIHTDSRFSRPDLLEHIGAVAAVPLIAREQTIGALWVGRLQPGLTTAEMQLLTAVGNIAANAVQRITLHEQTEQRLRQLQALRIIDDALAASLDLRLTLNVLLTQTTSQLGVDAAAILLYQPTTRKLEYAAGQGFRSRAIEQTSIRLGEDVLGRAILQNQPVQVTSLAQVGAEFTRRQLLSDERFVAYYVIPITAKGNLKGVLEVFHRNPLHVDAEWENFISTLANQTALAVDNLSLFDDLQRLNTELVLAYDNTLEGWSRALDLRDKETEGHTQRVTEMTIRLAQDQGFNANDLLHVRRGALLHDIGKMGIPDSILLKAGPLTEEEWVVMRKHPEYAYNLLKPITFLNAALEIPYSHHEKWDGSGYPRGLKGTEIPLAARLFAVVDVWDALSSDRPYRTAWEPERVRRYLLEESGKHFDPQAVEAFINLALDT
jgi:PAS domain S-box-containing protein